MVETAGDGGTCVSEQAAGRAAAGGAGAGDVGAADVGAGAVGAGTVRAGTHAPRLRIAESASPRRARIASPFISRRQRPHRALATLRPVTFNELLRPLVSPQDRVEVREPEATCEEVRLLRRAEPWFGNLVSKVLIVSVAKDEHPLP